MKAAPKVTTAATRAKDWRRLCSRVFRFDSSKADERYFKMGIHEWLIGNRNATFNQTLFKMVHARNGGGVTLKYCYFNDHQQRVFLSRDFEEWAKTTKKKIEETLIQINEAP